MTGQYLRKCRLIVRPKSGDAMDLSGLRIRFSVERALTDEAGTGRVSIYNPALSTIRRIQKGDKLILEAGYETGHFGLIFSGDVLYAVRRLEDSVTTVLEIVCRDGDQYLTEAFTARTIGGGATASDVVAAALKGAAIETGFVTEGLSNLRAPRGKTLFGRSADYLKSAGRSADAQFYIENGAVNIVKSKDYADNEAVVLTGETGLIGTPEQQEDAVSGTCLINPRIKLKTKLHISPSLIKALEPDEALNAPALSISGIYSVVRLKYEGDTRGEDWYIHFDAIEQPGQEPVLLSGSRSTVYR